MSPVRGVSNRQLLRVLWRSFALQAGWNFQRMQNLGFAFALDPVLVALYGRTENRLAALRRHLDFFVTHPYFASVILGVTARLEADRILAQESERAAINQIKAGMMGPLAALGDSLFWAALKPALALLGVAMVLLTTPGQVWPAAVGPWVFLGLFTAGHLAVRVGGLWTGFRRGVGVIQDLRRLRLQSWTQRLFRFMTMVVGVLAAGYVSVRPAGFTPSRWLDAPLLIAVCAVAVWGVHRGIAVSRLFYALLIAAVLGGYLGLGL